MQAQRIARELALLSLSQLSRNPEKLAASEMQDVVLAAIRTLTGEVHESLETAAAELKRGSERLLNSETRSPDLDSARAMVKEAIELTQTAINRMGAAIQLPEFINLANQKQVRAYSLEILSKVNANRKQIDEILNQSLIDWQLNRLPKIDRDILRIAVAEIMYMGVPERVAINEAVELSKIYSGEDGYRFINGVLRRVSERLKQELPKV
ncbi:MAG: transcription antitermination factor NusB [Oscillatoriaceae bacterium SKW80]|nr:transcription antitermination factor NusB [Oscillatoriaceae bacterium SKYG93]MCX8120757.1 transcription antitermination factor NusB [Oscillatoriaceae bacterium SKW80]MDW8452122.1 transcription antitermination factor NusB [Oscillatoriaceae cyanobacterium SKYGB_i_bin93]HIK27782.1 transcription antitermination protein NusB [Oscillatoriaceae cyanobacterium M7585_C2015_266]